MLSRGLIVVLIERVVSLSPPFLSAGLRFWFRCLIWVCHTSLLVLVFVYKSNRSSVPTKIVLGRTVSAPTPRVAPSVGSQVSWYTQQPRILHTSEIGLFSTYLFTSSCFSLLQTVHSNLIFQKHWCCFHYHFSGMGDNTTYDFQNFVIGICFFEM